MKTIQKCGHEDYSILHFDWFFTDWCNYACSYCSAKEDMVENFSKSTSPSKYKLVLSRFKMMKQNFHVELLGGEPTLHPHILDVVTKFCEMDHCKDLEVITNLSRTIKFYSQFNEPHLAKTRIVASYHPEYFDHTFVEKCIAITNMEHVGFMVNVNLPDQPDDWSQTQDLFDTFEKEGVPYGFNFLHSIPGWEPNYTPEFYEVFNPYFKSKEIRDIPHEFTDGTSEKLTESEVINRGFNHFEGYDCQPMMYQIFSDGTIKNQCTQTTIPITMKDMVNTVKCPLKECPCDIMFKFPKEKR